jgi:hypothetical protein
VPAGIGAKPSANAMAAKQAANAEPAEWAGRAGQPDPYDNLPAWGRVVTIDLYADFAFTWRWVQGTPGRIRCGCWLSSLLRW